MKVEIQEIYPKFKQDKFKKKYLFGYSIHTHLIDEDHLERSQDVRGIMAIKIKNDWFIKLPTDRGFDKKTRQMVKFPIIDWVCKPFKNAIIEEIKHKFIDFLEKKLSNDKYNDQNYKIKK